MCNNNILCNNIPPPIMHHVQAKLPEKGTEISGLEAVPILNHTEIIKLIHA